MVFNFMFFHKENILNSFYFKFTVSYNLSHRPCSCGTMISLIPFKKHPNSRFGLFLCTNGAKWGLKASMHNDCTLAYFDKKLKFRADTLIPMTNSVMIIMFLRFQNLIHFGDMLGSLRGHKYLILLEILGKSCNFTQNEVIKPISSLFIFFWEKFSRPQNHLTSKPQLTKQKQANKKQQRQQLLTQKFLRGWKTFCILILFVCAKSFRKKHKQAWNCLDNLILLYYWGVQAASNLSYFLPCAGTFLCS